MPGVLTGYATRSTYDRHASLNVQIRDLKATGCSEQIATIAQWTHLVGRANTPHAMHNVAKAA
jgi:hypothetical protein